MRKTLIMIFISALMVLIISCNGNLVPSGSSENEVFTGTWTTGIVIQEETSLFPSVYYYGEKTDISFSEKSKAEVTVTYWIRLKNDTENDWVQDAGKKTVKESYVKQVRYEKTNEWKVDFYKTTSAKPCETIIWRQNNKEAVISSTRRGNMYLYREK